MSTFRSFRLCPALIVVALAACGSPPHESAAPDPGERARGGDGDGSDTALTGELRALVMDRNDGTSEAHYLLEVDAPGGGRRLVSLDRDPRLPLRSRIRVRGRQVGPVFRIAGAEPVAAGPAARPSGDLETRTSALIGAGPLPLRRLAFVPVNFGGGVGLTAAAARDLLIGTTAGGQSLKQQILALSYGRQDLDATVLAPIASPPLPDCSSSTLQTLADTLRPMVTGTFDHYMWYFGTAVGSCYFSGAAFSGTAMQPERDIFYNDLSGCTTLPHELGHNLGLEHASFIDCAGASFADDPISGCTSQEYGDTYDFMGQGCGETSGIGRAYLGWLGGCNLVDVKHTGTFTLFPIEQPCNGVQVLKLPMPGNRAIFGDSTLFEFIVPIRSITFLKSYYVEMRVPAGGAPMVEVRTSDDIDPQVRRGQTWILDADPAAAAINGLKTGVPLVDPEGNVLIRLDSISATKAQVTIEIDGGTADPPTCLDGTTLLAPGPATCQENPVPVPDGGAGGASGGAGGAGGGTGGGTGGTGGGAGGASGGTGGTGGGGSGGTAGRGGAGAAGRGGTGGGIGGAAGGAGTAGASGRGGTGGVAGAAAGAGGAGGASGTSGTTGSAGTSATAGSGGAGAAGVAGTAGSAGTGGGEVTSGGCGCGVATRPGGGFEGLAAIVLLSLALGRRRPRRPERDQHHRHRAG
jgi:hypothetical protein